MNTESNRSLNKKILKFGCLPVVVFIIIIIFAVDPKKERTVDNDLAEINEDIKRGESIPTSEPETVKPRVYNSSYDNSVFHVERYLKANLNDPDSYEPIQWWEVQEANIPEAKYFVRHKYRGKNRFGALVVENKVFFMDSDGKVLFVK